MHKKNLIIFLNLLNKIITILNNFYIYVILYLRNKRADLSATLFPPIFVGIIKGGHILKSAFRQGYQKRSDPVARAVGVTSFLIILINYDILHLRNRRADFGKAVSIYLRCSHQGYMCLRWNHQGHNKHLMGILPVKD